MAACLKGDGPTISALAAGASLDVQNADGFSALIYASLYGALRRRARARRRGRVRRPAGRAAADGPLYTCRRGHAPAARLLLEAGARTDLCEGDQQRTALQWAAENGHTGLVSLLETHAITPLVRAADDADAAAAADGARPAAVSAAAPARAHRRPERAAAAQRPHRHGDDVRLALGAVRHPARRRRPPLGGERMEEGGVRRQEFTARHRRAGGGGAGWRAVGAADRRPAPGSARARARGRSPAKAAELPADVLEAVCDGDTAAAELWLRRGGHVDGRGPEEEVVPDHAADDRGARRPRDDGAAAAPAPRLRRPPGPRRAAPR